MYSYSNSHKNTLFFQYVIVIILIIITSFIYYVFLKYNDTSEIIIKDLEKIDTDLKKLDNNHLDPVNLEDSRNLHKIKNKIDHIPTVDDIVSAIFPGRTTMIVSGGNIQNINRSNDINTYSSDYSIYQPIKAFPVEPDDPLSIPMPLTANNPLSISNNTYNNNFMDTQTKSDSLTRMNQGLSTSQNSSTGSNNNNQQDITKSRRP